MSEIDRRQFLGRSAAVAGSALFSAAAVERLQARTALARDTGARSGDGGYGPVRPVAEAGSDGREILA